MCIRPILYDHFLPPYSPYWVFYTDVVNCDLGGGGGGGGVKALTMIMTPWNLPHGQWSKKLTMTMAVWHPRFCQWSKLTNFDHLTMEILKFWTWSWSKFFDHLTMTPGRRPNGQKIVAILPPPPPPPLDLVVTKSIYLNKVWTEIL